MRASDNFKCYTESTIVELHQTLYMIVVKFFGNVISLHVDCKKTGLKIHEIYLKINGNYTTLLLNLNKHEEACKQQRSNTNNQNDHYNLPPWFL